MAFQLKYNRKKAKKKSFHIVVVASITSFIGHMIVNHVMVGFGGNG